MKRPHGTGQIYVKSGAYYGRWRARDGRRRNKRLGPVRPPGSSEGLTRAMAEQALRRAQEDEPAAPVADDGRGRTVNDAANALRERLELQGARKSYRQNCESMQRVHISPAMGSRRVGEVSTVIAAIPNEVVRRTSAPTRRGRRGPSPPPPPDVLGPVLRVLILAAAVTGLRQSELLGIRWRDIDEKSGA